MRLVKRSPFAFCPSARTAIRPLLVLRRHLAAREVLVFATRDRSKPWTTLMRAKSTHGAGMAGGVEDKDLPSSSHMRPCVPGWAPRRVRSEMKFAKRDEPLADVIIEHVTLVISAGTASVTASVMAKLLA